MSNAALYPSSSIVNSGACATTGAGMPGTAAGGPSAWRSGASCSPESVAYSLMLSIACAEGVVVNTATGLILGGANRQWILSTYAECLQAVGGCGTQYGQVSSFRQAG